jgi:hypothetical protein
MKNHFAGMRNRFAGMQNHFSGMQNHFAGMRNRFAGMKNHFPGMKNRFYPKSCQAISGLDKMFYCRWLKPAAMEAACIGFSHINIISSQSAHQKPVLLD